METTKFEFDEDTCPAHVGMSSNPKRCWRCGVHVDSFRPSEPDEEFVGFQDLEGKSVK